jgi:hypothetical protein
MILMILRIGLRSRGNHETHRSGIVLLDGEIMVRTHEIVVLYHGSVVRTRGRDPLMAQEKCALSSPLEKLGPEVGGFRLRIYRGRWVEGLPGLSCTDIGPLRKNSPRGRELSLGIR